MKIIDELQKIGIELSDEQKNDVVKKFTEEVVSKAEHEKKTSKLLSDKEVLEKNLAEAKETLAGFEGKDFEAINKELADWKIKAENLEKEYSQKLADREKSDLLKEAFADIEFTSESAKRSIMADIKENVIVKDGKLIGFDDLLKDAREKDSGAFVDKEKQELENNKPRFTQSNKLTGDSGTTTKEQILAIKDRAERQEAIAANIGLFSGIGE